MSISKSNEYSQTEVMLQGLKSFENKQSVKEKDPIKNSRFFIILHISIKYENLRFKDMLSLSW